MTESQFKFPKPPIVEAVLDIDCDLPPGIEIEALEEPARESFRDEYPKFRPRHSFKIEHEVQLKGGEPPKTWSRREAEGIDGYMFLKDDEKQLIQLRRGGFSFNRLKPYTSLDDYLPEIERTWGLFVQLAQPVEIRCLRLRYINKIPLPSEKAQVQLDAYLKAGPRLPDEQRLTFHGFLNRYTAGDIQTGNVVKTTLTSKKPEDGTLPVIFDIAAESHKPLDPKKWSAILARIQSLRDLKNHVFRDTLTPECLELFR